MSITKKTKRVIISVLAACSMVIAVWSVMCYQARRELVEQFNSDLALRFDDIIGKVYPLIDSYTAAMNGRADSIEVMAERAKADKERSYLDAFSVSWERYISTPDAKKCLGMMEEYEYLRHSHVYAMLTNSGDKRKEEADALEKLSVAGLMLKEPYFLEYDSLMSVTKTARQYIADYQKVMEPYRSQQTNIRAWRDITPQDYFKMFEKYNNK